MSLLQATHRRKNPLTGDWILVSPHRNNRPWSGATEAPSEATLPAHEDNCPLCAGNKRANGDVNPKYKNTHVFANDFGALTEDTPQHDGDSSDDLFTFEAASGSTRVVCFSPEHNKTLPELSEEDVLAVVNTWQSNYTELSEKYHCIHIFENKGAVMGCSQPHPHGQIWAHQHLSTEISKEEDNQRQYFEKHGSNLLGDYVAREQANGQRIVAQNEHWIVLVPFWAAWPFETLLVSKTDVSNFTELTEASKKDLASIIRILTIKYDNVFKCSFPYSMGWHNAPTNLTNKSHWRLHAHFYPPLLRSASVKKHMVGYEMLAESQRDISAESAAKILSECSTTHYKSEK